MIYTDKWGYPCSKDDGMDSAVRAGITTMTGSMSYRNILLTYEVKPGILVRHPEEPVANNPKNFTRDQLLCLVAGMCAIVEKTNSKAYLKTLKDVFYSRFKSGFFMQNTERDKPGSKKLLYPHKFFKDSYPNTMTVLTWSDLDYHTDEIQEGRKASVESRYFDGPDPLLPNHTWFLIKAARIKLLYPFALIGIPFFILTVIAHSLGKHEEQNQMIAEAYVNGSWALKFFKFVNRKWEAKSKKYWRDRNEGEYHDMLVEFMKKY